MADILEPVEANDYMGATLHRFCDSIRPGKICEVVFLAGAAFDPFHNGIPCEAAELTRFGH
jgi:hypothetical protein